MERKQIVIPAEQIARQREFINQLAALHTQRRPLAMVDTYGCQQNVADSQRMMGMLRDMGCGFTENADEADIIVINTCAIRENAEKKVFGVVGQLVHAKEKNPNLIIALCGCMAQQEVVANRIKKSYRHVDLVFGPQALWKFPELLYRVYTNRRRVFSIEDEHGSIAEGLPVVRESSVKAWVSIMYGCNNFCSYCIVPYVRGRERSREAADILTEVRQLVSEGYREITLLGQNVNSYGKDLETPMDFADLLAEIDKIEGDYLIRFMTSHPKDASQKLFDTMARCSHVAKQLHLPVQSGNSRVLKEMNRGYTREQYLEKVRYAKSVMPDLVLTSDIIIGFPGETEDEAMDTVSLIREVRYDALFTFIYSPRPGTPAAKMPDPASRAEKQVWFDRLLDAQNEISAQLHRDYVGKSVTVLVDGESDDVRWPLSSRTQGGRLVHLAGDKSLIGQYITVKITDSNTWALFGEVE
ncbi:MAG: tRNA (N6-isopentenyl adenosine(37)-C2)-methylthiotransferase MiaB [Oscillospiraceae bacterium]|nr:tRNA (N6-isopentenyl adenosine(37)-C2)-methylthiotransferase MiaB [Oscillospiraceae bacterium]